MEQKTIDRFWKKVIKGKEDECWLWIGVINKGGYGRISIKEKSILIHRFSYELHKGKIPNGLYVLHSCDNPPCCNPKHLWLGTLSENTQDMWNKNRRKRIDEIKYKSTNGYKFSLEEWSKKYCYNPK
jgi:hypothetical protein